MTPGNAVFLLKFLFLQHRVYYKGLLWPLLDMHGITRLLGTHFHSSVYYYTYWVHVLKLYEYEYVKGFNKIFVLPLDLNQSTDLSWLDREQRWERKLDKFNYSRDYFKEMQKEEIQHFQCLQIMLLVLFIFCWQHLQTWAMISIDHQ